MKTYTPEQVAELESVNRETVLGWIRGGELAAHSVSANPKSRKPRWRVTEAALAAFRLTRQANTPKQPAQRRGRKPVGQIPQYV